MENPATWDEVTKLIDKTLRECDLSDEEGVCGASRAKRIRDALVESGLILNPERQRLRRIAECDHLRPVAKLDGQWYHLDTYEDLVGIPISPCSAGIYAVEVKIDSIHYIRDMLL